MRSSPHCKSSTSPRRRSGAAVPQAAVIGLMAAVARHADAGKLNPNAEGIIVTACYPGELGTGSKNSNHKKRKNAHPRPPAVCLKELLMVN